jgi:tRNA pseudouridine32 synthase / 23S rRNA pseudouridine746 synthase
MQTPASPSRRYPYAPPPDLGLDVVHEDAHLLAVNKANGLLSVPGRGAAMQDCLASRVQARWPQALVVHRLDEDTSGLVLFALNADVQRQLSAAFESRTVDKRYTAVVHGLMAHDQGEVTARIGRNWAMRPMRCIDPDDGQSAHTVFKVIQRNTAPHTTRVMLQALTGRTHQLRVHMAHIGHAICGDALYGNQEALHAAPRLMLHAQYLAFTHPVTGQSLELYSEAPF